MTSSWLHIRMFVYSLFWHLGLPFALFYLWRRGRKDPDYTARMSERFGAVTHRVDRPIWVHTVSLGEFRSAEPLIRALIERGEKIHLTTTTPAGQRGAMAAMADEFATGQISMSWCPIELPWAWRRFFRDLNPKCGLVMEIEIWPQMIASASRAHVPLYLANAQYPERSFARDMSRTKFRRDVLGLLAGAMVKSDLHAERFRAAGVTKVAVTGELRFDQPIPRGLIEKGHNLRAHLGADDRLTVAIASAVKGEDELLAQAIASIASGSSERPMFIYVPRAPERFGEVAEILRDAGLSVVARSTLCDANLRPIHAVAEPPTVFLGDSLGEMYAYLTMADRVVVGGGFVKYGAHNISEALALAKPVWSGPHIWTIAYPAEEAIEADVLRIVPGAPDAIAAAIGPDAPEPAGEAASRAFFQAHSGATEKSISVLSNWLELSALTDKS